MKPSEMEALLTEQLKYKRTASGLKLYNAMKNGSYGKKLCFNVHNQEGQCLTIYLAKKATEEEVIKAASDFLKEN